MKVAPLAGAWIEIGFRIVHTPHIPVAPLAGAWIEILLSLDKYLFITSLPLRERGLKS